MEETYEDLEELFEEKVDILDYIQDNNSVLYYTASWCGPCKKIYPNLCKLNSKLDYLTIYKIDIDKNEKIVDEKQIKGVPTFEYYCDKKLKGTITGSNIIKLLNFLKEHKE
jgi:thiol-disulfide isomerase/thioredoxin